MIAEKERTGIIYLAVNRVNQKAYVGCTTRNLEKRIAEHVYDSRRRGRLYPQLFHGAIKRYGAESFDFGLLERCNISDWPKREEYWISILGSIHPNGYNSSAGRGMLGMKRDCDLVEKLRAAAKRPKAETTKAKLRGPKTPGHIANSVLARKSPEYKKLASASGLRAWQDPLRRERQSAATKEQWRKWREKREMENRSNA